MNIFKNIFKKKYSEYEFLKSYIKEVEIYKNKYDDLMLNDPDEIESIPTGKFKNVECHVFVRYNLKTGKPQYRIIEFE